MTSRTRPLRWRLFLLVAAAIAPVALMSAVSVAMLAHQRRVQTEAATLDLCRALMTAVDNELQRSIAALEVLSSSDVLDNGGALDTFRLRAGRVAASQPHWVTISLADPAGRVLLATDTPQGPAPRSIIDRPSFEEAVRTQHAVVGRLTAGPRGHYAVAVRVPVLRDGRLRYVLSAVLQPDAIDAVLRRQQVPEGSLISVFDSQGLRVARSAPWPGAIGGRAGPMLAELMRGRTQGTGPTHTFEGADVYSAFTRSPVTGWSVAAGVPADAVFSGIRRSLLVYGGGLALSLLLGAMAAAALARGVLRPARSLRAAAEALGRGEQPLPAASNVEELQAVSDALVAAAARRQADAAERTRLYEAAQQARAQAEAANRAKDEFLAMLGHELRNPLAPIVTALQLMGRHDAQAHQAERRILQRQVAHLTRLVDDLLDVARFARGKVQLQLSALDLRDAVARALELVEPLLASRRPLALTLPPAPVMVQGDAVRLAQVFGNLLANAAKFTPPDGRIALTLRLQDEGAEVLIEDEGQGIAPELLPQVFDLFVQGRQSLDRHVGGLGLGLAIVRTLVELHGGRVAAASEGEGRGSRFSVWLPLARVQAAAEPAPALPAASVPPPSAVASRRILLVDDNLDALQTLQTLLELDGHRVQPATGAEEALAGFEAAAPDVAILDIGLPGMDGYELARRLRALPGGADCRLIALTGYGHELDRARALQAGFDEHLTKPVEIAALEAMIAGPCAEPA
jgi:signal transduction histidine kinase/CheY-like chemotaxis protein